MKASVWFPLLRVLTLLVVVGLALSAPHRCDAVLVGIDYFDQKPSDPQRGGPHWKGVVDTAADTLSIYSWEEFPGHGPDFWTPVISQSPLVWAAVGSDGLTFDVPDNFGANGNIEIGDNWGFVSGISANEMAWEDGDYQIVSVDDYYPGWGVVQRQRISEEVPGELEFFYDATADETSLPRWPIHEFGFVASLNATVTLVGVASVTAVPEVTAPVIALVAVSIAGVVAIGKRSARTRG